MRGLLSEGNDDEIDADEAWPTVNVLMMSFLSAVGAGL